MPSPADLIDLAISRIAWRQNWCQGKLSDGEGRYCAVGALAVSAFGPGDNSVLSRYLILSRMDGDLRVSARKRHDIASFRLAIGYMNRAAQRRGFEHIMKLNDNQLCFFKRSQHRAVLEAMRDAAKEARADYPKSIPPLEPKAPAPAEAMLVS